MFGIKALTVHIKKGHGAKHCYQQASMREFDFAKWVQLGAMLENQTQNAKPAINHFWNSNVKCHRYPFHGFKIKHLQTRLVSTIGIPS